MSEPLSEWMDARKIAKELGISLDSAYKIMQQLPKVRPIGLRKVYVRRSDLEQYQQESLVLNDGGP